jgi:ABC-type multidrug transport system ATPase subunit
MSAIALSIRGLSKSFARGLARCRRRTLALVDVNLDLYRSEIVVLHGAAGAGKTTLLQCAAGLLRPDSGSVMAGHGFHGGRASPVAYVPAIPIYYPFLTVSDVVSLRASRFDNRQAGVTDEALDLLELHRVRNDIVATLSRSQLMRLCIAEAIVNNPVAVMIDTADSNSFTERNSLARSLARVASAGIAVMIADRDEGALRPVAHRAIQLSEGCVLAFHPAPMFVAEQLH